MFQSYFHPILSSCLDLQLHRQNVQNFDQSFQWQEIQRYAKQGGQQQLFTFGILPRCPDRRTNYLFAAHSRNVLFLGFH